jgi:hypothetical protein
MVAFQPPSLVSAWHDYGSKFRGLSHRGIVISDCVYDDLAPAPTKPGSSALAPRCGPEDQRPWADLVSTSAGRTWSKLQPRAGATPPNQSDPYIVLNGTHAHDNGDACGAPLIPNASFTVINSTFTNIWVADSGAPGGVRVERRVAASSFQYELPHPIRCMQIGIYTNPWA